MRTIPRGFPTLFFAFAMLLATSSHAVNKNLPQTCEAALKNSGPFISPKAALDPKTGKIKLSLSQHSGLKAKTANAFAQYGLAPILKVGKIQKAIDHLSMAMTDPAQADKPYFQKVAEAFQVTPSFNEEFLKDIPKTGPVVVTMNHPLSGPELIVVASVIQRIRPDVKVVSSKFLELVPGFEENTFLIDNMTGSAAKEHNLKQRTRMFESLEKGEVIVISPAGAVSVKENLKDQHVSDPVWKLGVAELVQKFPQTAVLPIYVEGGPTQLFHQAKRISPFAGTAMIPREIAEVIGSTIRFAISKPVRPETLAKFGRNRKELMAYLRARTYLMSEALNEGGAKVEQTRERKEPIGEPIATDLIEAELANSQVIFDMAPDNADKAMKTYLAYGADIPNTLQELGRLREVTFWAANEGTGMARDLDEYDPNYLHLIAYDKKQKKIAGAYRIGLMDQLVSKYGIESSYIAKTFDVGPHLDKRLARLVEVGRTFVLPEYQGRSFAFPALFQGLGRFLASHPQYEGFFGAVSISDEYRDISKQVILKWAEHHVGAEEFGQVAVKNPPELSSALTPADLAVLLKYTTTMQELNDLVASSEGSPKARAPQLIQIYLDVGCKFLAFDKDSDFNTIDGLIFTSILNLTHEQRLNYMGVEGTKNFEDYWRLNGAVIRSEAAQ